MLSITSGRANTDKFRRIKELCLVGGKKGIFPSAHKLSSAWKALPLSEWGLCTCPSRTRQCCSPVSWNIHGIVYPGWEYLGFLPFSCCSKPTYLALGNWTALALKPALSFKRTFLKNSSMSYLSVRICLVRSLGPESVWLRQSAASMALLG